MTQKKEIQAYNLAEFCQLSQQAFLEGFKFDFDKNEHYPTSFGAFYSAVMVQAADTAAEVLAIQKDAASTLAASVAASSSELVQQVQTAAETLVELSSGPVEDAIQAVQRGRPKKG